MWECCWRVSLPLTDSAMDDKLTRVVLSGRSERLDVRREGKGEGKEEA